MDFEEIKRRWLAAKSGFIPESDLIFVRQDTILDGYWYKCLCGGEDHLGWRPFDKEGYSKFLSIIFSCYVTDQQWVITRPSVAQTLYEEEKKYFDLLAKSEEVAKKVIAKRGWSDETIKFLYETHGIHPDVSEAFKPLTTKVVVE